MWCLLIDYRILFKIPLAFHIGTGMDGTQRISSDLDIATHEFLHESFSVEVESLQGLYTHNSASDYLSNNEGAIATRLTVARNQGGDPAFQASQDNWSKSCGPPQTDDIHKAAPNRSQRRKLGNQVGKGENILSTGGSLDSQINDDICMGMNATNDSEINPSDNQSSFQSVDDLNKRDERSRFYSVPTVDLDLPLLLNDAISPMDELEDNDPVHDEQSVRSQHTIHHGIPQTGTNGPCRILHGEERCFHSVNYIVLCSS